MTTNIPVIDGFRQLFHLFFGTSDNLLHTLILFVILDYISGVCVAIRKKKISSAIGTVGIAKKVGIFVLISLSHICDQFLIGEGNAIRTVSTIFYLSNEAISIFENAGKLGLDIPVKLKELIQALRRYGKK